MKRGKSLWSFMVLLCAVGALALAAAGSATAAIDKVFYRDANYNLSWNNAEMADQLTTYLGDHGFTEVDSDGLRDFCLKHIQDRATSVVVMVNDVLPDTVMDPLGDNKDQPNPDCTFNRYLQNGGKVVYLFDWPGYYLGKPGGNVAWNDTGAAAALGFWPCRWNGQTDNNTAVVFNDEGKAWGLTKPWQTKRAANPLSDVDIVLGTPSNRTDAATPWVKTYVFGRPGAGFIYLYDLPAGDAINGGNPVTTDPFNEDDMKQIVAVANYFPAGEVRLYGITTTVKETGGKSVAGLKAVVTAADGATRTVTLSDSGTFTLAAAPGTYSITVQGATLDSAPTTTVTVSNADVTASLDVTLLPFATLTSADSVDWKLFTYAADGDAAQNAENAKDYAPAAANFNDSSWVDITVPGNAENEVGYNTYFWYRAHFTIPQALKAYKDRYLVIDNFNIDDNDETFINGVKVGGLNGWNTMRAWVIDPSIINWDGDNVIAIKGYQGGGGAGMNNTTAGPRLRVGAISSGMVKGKANLTATEPAASVNMTLTSADGKTILNATSAADGTYSFRFVPVGDWSLGATGKFIARTNPASVPVTVQGAKIVSVPDVSVLYKALPEFSTVVDKAVYYDDTHTTGWLNQTESEFVRDFFVDKGYQLLDAEQLASFMQAHVTSKVPSVVVAARDIFPDTVVDISSGGVVKTNLINDYMNTGGRVLQFRDIPFYNISQSGGLGNLNAADNGSITILGFSAGGGTRDVLDTSNVTVYGRALGLTTQWISQRPARMDDIDVPLATASGGAAGWIKFFPDSKGPGMFVYMLDDASDRTQFTDAFLTEAQKVIEAKGTISGPGIDTGVAPGVKGDVNGNGKLDITDVVFALRFVANLVTPTDAQKAIADVNANGRVDITDVLALLRAVAGLATL